MSKDRNPMDLTRNVHELRQKLMRTEKSINNLEQLAQREYSFDEQSAMSSHVHDETSSLPPPLTMEELMLESTLESSYADRDYTILPSRPNTGMDRPSSRARSDHSRSNTSTTSTSSRTKSLSGLSEHTMTDISESFHPLNPNLSHYTSSPRKNISSRSSFLPGKNTRTLSYETLPNVDSRPDSFASYNQFQAELRSSREKQIAAKESTSDTFHDLEPVKSSDLVTYSSTVLKNEYDETLPSEINEECSNLNISEYGPADVSPQRPISARSNATSITLTASGGEADRLKDKLSSVRSDNARLRTLVTQLRHQVNKYTEMADTSMSSGTNAEHLSEKILCLMDEIKANEKTLRQTEDRLDYKDKLSAEKDQVINGLKNRMSHMQSILEASNNQKSHAESARDDAFHDVAQLSQRLQESHSLLSTKLNESKKRMHGDLAKVANERTHIMKQYESVKRESETLQNKLRASQRTVQSLENKHRSQEIDAAKTMDQAQQRIRELVQELEGKHSNLKKCKSDLSIMNEQHQILNRQYNEMKDQNICQRDRIDICQKENEEAKSQIESLKDTVAQIKASQERSTTSNSTSTYTSTQRNALNDLTNQSSHDTDPLQISPRKHKAVVSELNMKLSSKEAHIKRLEARLSGFAADAEKLETLREDFLTLGEKSRASERRANELEDVVHLMEDERTKYLKKVNDLEDHIHDKTSECESLETRLKERTNNLKTHQVKVEEMTLKISSLEIEVKHKKDEISTLERKDAEQSSEEQLLKLKLSEIQTQLLEKTRALDNATEWSGKQESDARREMKKIKKIHTEQCQEMEEQIEMLRDECDKHKNQSTSAKQQLSHLNQTLVVSDNRIQQLEEEVDFVRREEKSRTQSHEEALKILEEKSSTSANHVKSLEGALAQCKNEVSVYIEQLHETHSNFQHQVALKSDQVAKLETELKLAQSSLNDETSHTSELESALEERHKMLEDAASRIAELEESQSALQSQVAKQEQLISRENLRAGQLIKEMESKLKVACLELDAKNQQFTQLNDALKKVDDDFNECKAELTSVELQLVELRSESELKSHELERSKFEWEEMKSKLDSKIERVAALEDEMQKIDREYKQTKEKNLDLETKVTQLESEAEDALQHTSELQAYSQQRNADVIGKEATIAQLQESLKYSRCERDKSREENRELERSLEERQWQLQQRAAKLTQLDMQLREFRSTTEKRNVELENDLEQSQNQLKERNTQVSHLDDRVTSMRDEMGEVRHQLEEQGQNVKRLERELAQKNDRVEEMTKIIEAERRSREERHKACIETSQEVRLAREREQKITRDFQESQREIGRLHREQQQLLADMDDMGSTNHEKDDRLNKLTKQFSVLASEKIAIETRYQDEMDRMQVDLQKLREEHLTENEKLRTSNAELLIKSRVATGNQEFEINSALDRERESRDEVRRAKESLVVLERELLARKQVIDAANDAIIVKDGEIARLQAKISGLERGAAMSSLPNTPVKLHPSVPTNPPLDVSSVSMPMKPAWDADVTATSMFTGIESDLGSLAPSFVPIAASTKRHPGGKERTDDVSSFFLTSSPTHGVDNYVINSDFSAEEDSLYKRVFADTFQNSVIAETAPRNGRVSSERSSARRSGRAESINLDETNELRPEKCMAHLHEKLRASEQRRREVTSKLRHLKHTS